MQIKSSKDDRENAIRKVLSRIIHSRKTLIVIIILALLVGGSIGFSIGGFFGDSPSILLNGKNMLVSALKTFGWFPNEEEAFVTGVFYEKYKIPANYFKGLFTDLEQITIDIGNNDYQKLAYQRKLSLDQGSLVYLEDEEVPAKIHYKGQTVDVNLKLKGGYLTSHFAGERWSFRIDVKGDDTLFGMQSFCIQDPLTRDYIAEWLYYEALKREGLLAMRYSFIDVTINGKHKGVYALEENFDKRLIENNNLREGPIFRIYPNGLIIADQAGQTAKNPLKTEQFIKAKQLVESCIMGDIDINTVFDTDKLATYYAISDLLGGQHSIYEHNGRFYYNPITSKIEPIGFDAHDPELNLRITELFHSYIRTDVADRCFEDMTFYKKYNSELERVSEPEYLDKLFSDLSDGMRQNLYAIYKNAPWYHFERQAFYDNQSLIRGILNPGNVLYTSFSGATENGSIIVEAANIQSLPVEITGISYRDSQLPEFTREHNILPGKMPDVPVQYQTFEFKLPPDFVWSQEYIRDLTINFHILGYSRLRSDNVLPLEYLSQDFKEADFIRQSPNAEQFDFLAVDNVTANILIRPGNWVVDRNVIVPAGYTFSCGGGAVLDLKDNAKILSYSPLQFVGTEDNRIVIKSSDGSGQGIAVMETGKKSILESVVFEGLSASSQTGWALTGAVTFYESPVEIRDCRFSDNRYGDDLLNIVRSEFAVSDSVFENTLFDAFDVDFGKGSVTDTSFINAGNDALDLSGSEIRITRCSVNKTGDKGVSVGERSMVTIKNMVIKNSFVIVASKDLSQVDIENITASGSEYGFAVYQKKSEYGPSVMSVSSFEMDDVKTPYLIDKNSTLVVDGQKIKKTTQDIPGLLYESE